MADQTWHGFHLPLGYGWIDWHVPHFLQGEAAWVEFLAEQRARYPNIEAELAGTIRSLNRIWILRLRDGYELTPEYEEHPARGR